MKRFFKTFILFIALITCISFVACTGLNLNGGSGDIDTESGQNQIADLTETYNSISDATTALVNSVTDDQKNYSLPSTYNTDVYTISSVGNYYYTGTLTSAITAKASGNVHIYLDNVTLSVSSASAISAKSGCLVTITLIGNNVISNTDGEKHVINSKENLVINGTGTLTLTSTKSGIACDKTFIGLGGTINITAVKQGITANNIYIDGTTVNAVNVGKDVLHAESDYDEVETSPEFNFGAGFVYFVSGTINCTKVLGDGIQADSYVYIKGGTFNIATTPTWINYTAEQNNEKGMFNTSTHQKVARDNVKAGSTYAILEESVKGIKVGEIDYYLSTDTQKTNELTVESDKYSILIEGGTFNINTVDDAIHTNSGSVIVYGGNMTINTSDDGIHADTNLKIGGNAVIKIESCYEGIEAETIDVSGGDTTITALDDGINATNSELTENQQKQICQINISGGRIDVTVNPDGDRDGIDSNGGIKITGGTVITRGPNSNTASPIDAANAISITGGTVIVIGNAPGSSGGGGGHGGMNFPGGGSGEGTLTVSNNMIKTQSNNKGLTSGNHTVTVNGTTISYYNAYSYGGYTTVYGSASATIN